jgi:hypothetical protein
MASTATLDIDLAFQAFLSSLLAPLALTVSPTHIRPTNPPSASPVLRYNPLLHHTTPDARQCLLLLSAFEANFHDRPTPELGMDLV